MNTDSQWSKQEARFAHVTQVWLDVNHNTSVLLANELMLESYCMGKWAWQLSIKFISFMRLWMVAKIWRFIKGLLWKFNIVIWWSVYFLLRNEENDSEIQYSKTCLKWPLQKKTKIVFQDRLSINAGQKYCRMLQESILPYSWPSLSYHLS